MSEKAKQKIVTVFYYIAFGIERACNFLQVIAEGVWSVSHDFLHYMKDKRNKGDKSE